jgi:hypothetical protein
VHALLSADGGERRSQANLLRIRCVVAGYAMRRSACGGGGGRRHGSSGRVLIERVACVFEYPGDSRGVSTRTCATGVSGALQPGWKSSSVRAGSVWIYLWGAVRSGGHTGLLSATRFKAVSPGEFTLWKTMVIVSAGRSVVVRVAPSSMSRLRLAFQLPVSSPSRLADGQVADQFVPCSSGKTYFNGGLIVAVLSARSWRWRDRPPLQ